MIIKRMIQGSPEWLEMRKSYLGASDAATIMGVCRYGGTPYKLWLEKTGRSPGKKSNAAMQRGKDLEPAARAEFEAITGHKMISDMQAFNEAYPFMTASLDGIDFAQEHIVELKCCNASVHERIANGECPKEYWPQIQHQLAVTGLPFCYLCNYDGVNGVVMEVERDEEYIAKLVAAEVAFWQCVTDDVSPEKTDKEKLKESNLEQVIAIKDSRWQSLMLESQDIAEQVKLLKSRESEIKRELLDMSQGCAASGFGFRLVPRIAQGRIDYTAIPSLKDIDLEPFRKEPTISWRIERDVGDTT